MLEYAFRASPTLGEALGQVVRYGRVMHDRIALRLAPEGEAVRLTGTVPPAHPISRYQAELESLPADASVSSRARALVGDDLPSGNASVERVARQLGMSVRTPSRRLEAEGTSFRRLLDSVREELAFAHLRNPVVDVGEIAFLLGYSESSAFHRWFKRRTGRTPLAFRRAAAQRGATVDQ